MEFLLDGDASSRLVASMTGCVLCERSAVTLGRSREHGIVNSGAVTAHVDGVHHGQGTAYSEGETEKKSDGGCPVKGHNGEFIVTGFTVVG